MILLFALLGCTDPEPLAQSTCEASPGLSTDAAGLALLQPLLPAKSYEILSSAPKTAGHELIGDAGLAQIRAGTSCTIDEVASAGSGHWAVKITRTAPEVSGDGTIGAPVESVLEWTVMAAEGGRVDIGLERAAAMRKSINEALEKGELRRAASTMRTLSKSFPDPALAVDIAKAEAAQEAEEEAKAQAKAKKKAEDAKTATADAK